ncbi:hypothetical protein IPJ70_01450 [Candidatus Campbellbacteria bacterium]|nr:MAG: hypothetical protein IPJ70_01450 [Candidatus Campbellbacteria bacterium]
MFKQAIPLGILTVALIAGWYAYTTVKQVALVACTEEAKMCSDGSSVGRVGPRCEFAPCPANDTSATGTPQSIGCTKEMKVCADGSTVGRHGPSCVFDACPNPDISPVDPVACTMDAKLCSDGSGVGRTAPYCEFALCSDEGAISGKVTVGPICPVERLGVSCTVPAEAYTSREVILYANNGTTEIGRRHFTSSGTYQFNAPAGSYVIDIPHQAVGGSGDVPKKITVSAGKIVSFDFSIDTGIR